MRKLLLVLLLTSVLAIVLPVFAQEVTPESIPTTDLLPFPLTTPSEAQIELARQCSLSAPLGSARLVTPTAAPGDACGLAQQLVEVRSSMEEDAPVTAEELDRLRQIAMANPALLLRNELLFPYFHSVELVALPEVLDQPITGVALQYGFGELGAGLRYDLRVVNGDTARPIVFGSAELHSIYASDTPEPQPVVPETIDPALVQALATSLTDLVPVSNEITITACYDIYPDWTVTLRMMDGSTVTLQSYSSNMVGFGGPIQTMIDGQRYMQYSLRFIHAALDLLDGLGLGLGDRDAYTCGRSNDALFDLAYP